MAALQIVAFIVAVLVAYGMVQSDVAVMKEQIRQLREQVVDIQNDVKTLLRRQP